MMKLLILALIVGLSHGLVVSRPWAGRSVRRETHLSETFGLGLGEDTYENQPDLLKGGTIGSYRERSEQCNTVSEPILTFCVRFNGRRICLSSTLTSLHLFDEN
jgi:hypothetical protein